MLKVLHIGTEKKWRGAENQIFYLLKHHSEIGIESFIAYPENPELEKRLSPYAKLIRLPSSGGYSPASILKIYQTCKRYKIDLINTHSGNAHTLAYLAKVMGLKIPLVVHRRVAFKIKNRFGTRKKYLSNKVNFFLSISDAIRKDLINFGVSSEKIEVIRSAVDESRYDSMDRDSCREDISKKHGIPKDHKWIAIIGALTKEKNHAQLFQALAKIDKSNYSCLVLGDGEERSFLTKLCKDLKIEKKVHFLGFQKKIENFYKAIDILAHPSLSEGLGTTILEAVLSDTFVCASNVGGIPEIISHNESGYLFDPFDTDSIANLLIKSLDSDQYVMKKAAKEHVIREFSVKNMTKKITEVYKKVTL